MADLTPKPITELASDPPPRTSYDTVSPNGNMPSNGTISSTISAQPTNEVPVNELEPDEQQPPALGADASSRARPFRGAYSPAGPSDRRAPGGTIADRYRLLSQVGSDAQVRAEFWRARDTVLERDVALTLLRSGNDRTADMISRGLRWGQFEHIGCARLLDVMRNDHGELPDDVAGLAVTEWVPGKSLAEAVAGGPLRTSTVLSMLDPLAEAAESAHRQGLVLGCAHPGRVRFTPDGGARLAFALPHPDSTPAQDVRGLGALLYALLTGHWPLLGTEDLLAGSSISTEDELGGLPPAPRDTSGAAVPPSTLRPGVSVEVSALATGALGAGATHGRVHTAAAVHKVISELLESAAEAALLPPPDDGAPAAADEVWRSENGRPRNPDRVKKRKLSIGMGGLGLGMLAVIGYVGVQLGSFLGVSPSSPPKIVVTTPPPVAAQTVPAGPRPNLPPPGLAPAPGLPPAPGLAPPPVLAPTPGAGTPDVPAVPGITPQALVPVASAQIFDPSGDPDNPGKLSRAFDNDPNGGWSTYNYRSPFPAVKQGVGIMVSFAAPVQLSSLTIGSPSNGTVIEIRSAPSPNAQLAQTVPIGTANLDTPTTTVSLTGSQPVQNVLLWITKLGGGGSNNVTQINNLQFQRIAD